MADFRLQIEERMRLASRRALAAGGLAGSLSRRGLPGEQTRRLNAEIPGFPIYRWNIGDFADTLMMNAD